MSFKTLPLSVTFHGSRCPSLLRSTMIKRLTSILRSSKFHRWWVDLALRLVRLQRAEIAFDIYIYIYIDLALQAEKKKPIRIFPYWTVVAQLWFSKFWRKLEGEVVQLWYKTLLCEKIYRAANLPEMKTRIRGSSPGVL